VEKRLGISGKPQIEAYGIERFNALCRESVLTYLDEWERLTERIGFWLDTENAYRTMDTDYIESVWWSLAELFRRGLVYRSDKVVPYCPRCGTALSSHEVAQGYEDIEDPSVFVRFPLPDAPGQSLLVWTTTPWTLPANVAVAVNPAVDYALVEQGDETLIVAAPLVERVFGEVARPVHTIRADDLVCRPYMPPFDLVPAEHRVVPADFVTTRRHRSVHIPPPSVRTHGVAPTWLEMPNPNRPTAVHEMAPWEARAAKEVDATSSRSGHRGAVPRERTPHSTRIAGVRHTPIYYPTVL